MSGKSLQLRLVLAGAAALALALATAGVALTVLFERHVERRAIAEADIQLRTLVGGLAIAQGKPVLEAPLQDARFDAAYGGRYWQVQSAGSVLLRSRSLWDTELTLPQDAVPDEGAHVHMLQGPRGSELIAYEREIVLDTNGVAQRYRVVVAQDRGEIVAARNDFLADLAVALGILGLVLTAASLFQIRIGLRPLISVRAQLAEVRTGVQPRLAGAFPVEVSPLVQEINSLLDARDAAIQRARGRAADLAHGLKTPLTALNADVRRLRDLGHGIIADDLDRLGALMERHVQRELARARIAGRRGAVPGVPVRKIAESVAAVIARTPVAAGKGFDLDIDTDLRIAMDQADLEELLGNLIENASRYARSTIRIAAFADRAGQMIDVSDDGPGIAAADADRIAERGERLDESGGAGLGLAITTELVEAYGGHIRLGPSDLGGLMVEIEIPNPSR